MRRRSIGPSGRMTLKPTRSMVTVILRTNMNGNTTETISGLGFDKNGQTGAVKYVNPDKGNFALASGSDCTIAGAGMQNPTWSPVEAAADDPVYLFPNYSFEENYSEFWTRHLEWGNNTTHALDDSQSYAGAKSLHLSSDGAMAATSSAQITRFHQAQHRVHDFHQGQSCGWYRRNRKNIFRTR